MKESPKIPQQVMSDVMVPSKRARSTSFGNKVSEYSENHGVATSDWLAKNFLEQCRFCKKNLRHDEDVFMYGYFGAFCRKECRAKQMTCDFVKQMSSREKAKAKKGRTCGTKPKEEAFGGASRFYI